MFPFNGVTCWHGPEEDSQLPETNSPNGFNREVPGSFMAKMPNSHWSAVSRLGVTFIFHKYWCHFLSTGEPSVVFVGQLLSCGFPVTWIFALPSALHDKNTHEHGLLVLLGVMQ